MSSFEYNKDSNLNNFNYDRNFSDIFIRNVIAGLIRKLNGLVFYNFIDNKKIEVRIPFFYANSVDERFIKDHFVFWSDCVDDKLTGNYDVVPRGVIQLNSFTVNKDELANRYIRGSYIVKENGGYTKYNSVVYFLPVTLSFDVSVITSNYIESFKVIESVLSHFYKSLFSNIEYNGFRINVVYVLSDDFENNKPFEFSFDDKNNWNIIKFNITANATFPKVSKNDVFKNNKIILNFDNGFTNVSNFNLNDRLFIRITDPIDDSLNSTPYYFYSGVDKILIKWDSNFDITKKVNIKFKKGSVSNNFNEYVSIINGHYNNGMYEWNMPDLQDNPVIVSFSELVEVPAKIKPIFDINGQLSSLVIRDGGYGYSNNVKITLTPTNMPLNFTQAEVELEVYNGSIVGYQIINTGSNYPVTQIYDVMLAVIDSNLNNDVYDFIKIKVI